MQLGNSQVLARYQLGTTSKKRGIIIFFGYGFVPIFQVVLWPHSFSHFLSFSSFYHLINSLFFLYFTFVDLSSFSCFQYSLFSSLYNGFSRFFVLQSLKFSTLLQVTELLFAHNKEKRCKHTGYLRTSSYPICSSQQYMYDVLQKHTMLLEYLSCHRILYATRPGNNSPAYLRAV